MTKEKKQKQSAAVTKPPAIGIALGSGIARGLAHIGTLKALNRHDIYPAIVAGTSVGALVGGAYLAGKLSELEEWALSLNRRRVFSYMDLRVRSAGLISGKRLNKLLRSQFKGIKIEDLPFPFIAIASDLLTGHEVWLRNGNLVDAMRASFALPGIFPPLEINHRRLVDGALVNPVPVSPCRALGARLTLAVDLNTDLIGKATKPGHAYQTVTGFDMFGDEKDTPQKSRKKAGNSLTRRLFKRERNNPSLFGVMISALNIVQDRLTRSRLAGDPPDVHIKPHIGHIGLLEFEKAEELIHEGEESVERAISEIRATMEVLLPHDTP